MQKRLSIQTLERENGFAAISSTYFIGFWKCGPKAFTISFVWWSVLQNSSQEKRHFHSLALASKCVFLLYLLHKIKMICHRIFDTNLKRCVWSTVLLLYTHLLSTAQTITLKMMMLKKSISFCVYFSASRVDREAPWSRGCWRSRRLFPLPSIRSSRTNNHMEKTCG